MIMGNCFLIQVEFSTINKTILACCPLAHDAKIRYPTTHNASGKRRVCKASKAQENNIYPLNSTPSYPSWVATNLETSQNASSTCLHIGFLYTDIM